MRWMKEKLLLLLWICPYLLFGQTFSILSVERTDTTKQLKMEEMRYRLLLEKSPKNIAYNFEYGKVCYQLNRSDLAEKHLLLAKEKYPDGQKYLAEIYLKTYRFQEAKQSAIDYLAQTDSLAQRPLAIIRQADVGQALLQKIHDVKIVDSVVVAKSVLLKYLQLPAEIGTFDVQRNHDIDCWGFTTQRGNQKFCTTAPNGNSDLYLKYRLLDGWTTPTPLSEINSPRKENYPFLMLDGITLYFASDREGTLGGLDIFRTEFDLSQNRYFPPENIGMPFNSPYNDYLLVIDDIQQLGWFVSDRFQREGEVVIYTFIPNKETKIVQSENVDSLINIAKITHIAKREKRGVSHEKEQQTPPKSISTINIIINDSTVYHDRSTFRDSVAQRLYDRHAKIEVEIAQNRVEIDDLRKSYSEVEDEVRRGALTKKILFLENKQHLLKRESQALILQMRKKENDFLKENLKI